MELVTIFFYAIAFSEKGDVLTLALCELQEVVPIYDEDHDLWHKVGH